MVRVSKCLVTLSVLAAMMAAGCSAFTRSPRATVLLHYPHATESTLSASSREHFQAVSNVAHRDARALIEDIDLLFQTERPTRLTRWHDR